MCVQAWNFQFCVWTQKWRERRRGTRRLLAVVCSEDTHENVRAPVTDRLYFFVCAWKKKRLVLNNLFLVVLSDKQTRAAALSAVLFVCVMLLQNQVLSRWFSLIWASTCRSIFVSYVAHMTNVFRKAVSCVMLAVLHASDHALCCEHMRRIMLRFLIR